MSSHERPDGVGTDTVEAVGQASEAAEYLIRACGSLYEFHQLMGHLDLLLGEAAATLEEAGHHRESEILRTDVIGRNAIDGRWSFQIVEEFDDLYFNPVQQRIRDLEVALMNGRRHVYEAEMKDRRRTRGRVGHESTTSRRMVRRRGHRTVVKVRTFAFAAPDEDVPWWSKCSASAPDRATSRSAMTV